jgi:hypothetical protein
MKTHLVRFVPSRRGNRVDAGGQINPYDMDVWEVAGLEFAVYNAYQSRHYRTRSVLVFAGEDNVSNQPVPEQRWRNQATQGAHAFLTPLPVVISAAPERRLPTIDIDPGDLIVDPHLNLVLQVGAGSLRLATDNPVTVLACPPRTVDHAAFVEDLRAKQAKTVTTESW